LINKDFILYDNIFIKKTKQQQIIIKKVSYFNITDFSNFIKIISLFV